MAGTRMVTVRPCQRLPPFPAARRPVLQAVPARTLSAAPTRTPRDLLRLVLRGPGKRTVKPAQKCQHMRESLPAALRPARAGGQHRGPGAEALCCREGTGWQVLSQASPYAALPAWQLEMAEHSAGLWWQGEGVEGPRARLTLGRGKERKGEPLLSSGRPVNPPASCEDSHKSIQIDS